MEILYTGVSGSVCCDVGYSLQKAHSERKTRGWKREAIELSKGGLLKYDGNNCHVYMA